MSPSSAALFQTNPLYPFRFEPIYKHYLWGGTRFRELLHRSIALSENCTAESWEVSDHPHGRSVLKNGTLRGVTLQDIVLNSPAALFGEKILNDSTPPRQFPLLFKYLDAAQVLSVQVHPDAQIVTELRLNDREKTECWVVVDSQPGTFLWIGTDKEYSKEELERKIKEGNWEKILNRIEVCPGDCFLIPAGTVHALGQGILVAEVQTVSDVTFRLFDWNRLDADGHPRQLHWEQGPKAIHTPTLPVTAELPFKTEFPCCELLIEHPWFTMYRWTLDGNLRWDSDGRCHIWSVLEGGAEAVFSASTANETEILNRGDTILVPAVCPCIDWIPKNHNKTVLLDVVVKKC